MWTADTEGMGSTERVESVLVEALLTSQGSAPIPKGKKKRLHGASEDEDEDEYYGQYSESDYVPPRMQQGSPTRIPASIPGQSPLVSILIWF